MPIDWKANLSRYFEEARIIQSSKQEALEDFDQFCEFVAEPTFENLGDELEQFEIKTRQQRAKGKWISLLFYFSGSRIDNFTYTIELPKNSLELKLQLKIKGRKDKKSPPQVSVEPFMPDYSSDQLLKLDKAELIQDIIEHYRNFNFTALTSPE